jgi:hypothetical protein
MINIHVQFGVRENRKDNDVGPDDYTHFILFNACPTANFSFRFLTHINIEQKASKKNERRKIKQSAKKGIKQR